jgi:hypothetical protein
MFGMDGYVNECVGVRVSDWVEGLKEEVVALCTAVERVSG